MRTPRLALAGAVILVLLGETSGVVLAQDEPVVVATSATHVTGTASDKNWDASEAEYSFGWRGVDQLRGMRFHETWEWSDERLPADKTGICNQYGHPLNDSEEVYASACAYRLDGAEGSWSGTSTGYFEVISGSGFTLDVYVGEGAYEGLTLVLQCGLTTCDGYILEGDLPTMPDPVDPPAE
jgi:hypothetical protein